MELYAPASKILKGATPMKHVSSILIVTFLLTTVRAFGMANTMANALSTSAAAATPSYSQGYEDGFIYTAQQTGKGCQNRLSQAAVERLDKSIRVKKASSDASDGDGDSDGDDGVVRSFGDYNQGKMQGMGDAMSTPANAGDLCTNGD
jgi:hypothetical protein